jgi:DNA-binding transcriptional MerR regulator
MKTYSIGEVEEIIGVKSHVLRYWETIVPGIAPQKDMSGRRIYTQRDIERFSRLKYLIQEKKFTIEGARNELMAEASDISGTAENSGGALTRAWLLKEVSGIRSALLDIYRLSNSCPAANKNESESAG